MAACTLILWKVDIVRAHRTAWRSMAVACMCREVTVLYDIHDHRLKAMQAI